MRIFSNVDSEIINENISEEITGIFETMHDINSTINSYMIESSSIINESTFVETMRTVFQAISKFIQTLYNKFISVFMKQSEYVEYVINKYSDSIKNITDNDLKDIVYEYKEFTFPGDIPVFGYFNSVEKLISNLSRLKITYADIEDFKYIYTEQLSIIRGKIINSNSKISEHDFASQVRSLFRVSDEVFIKPLTKKDLNKMIDDIKGYKQVKKMIETDKDKILKEYEKYYKMASNIINVKYSDDAEGASLYNKDGKDIVTDIITANMYKEYQSLVITFITQIMESYSTVYKEKLSALKDKYDMEISVLKQIIRMVVI